MRIKVILALAILGLSCGGTELDLSSQRRLPVQVAPEPVPLDPPVRPPPSPKRLTPARRALTLLCLIPSAPS